MLSHDITSESDITPCNKVDKPLVFYRLIYVTLASILALRKRWQNLDIFMQKMRILSNFYVMW